ncbi:hypothetical protein M1C57_00785 [Rhodococcus pyridinivorans]|uniref:Uncharacterized protein n=2 Tax=Rhodococcus TaxID=1827 RepID=A0A7M2XU82_9NOCA|nr:MULTISPECIES: hypothetical protein [Rhodococcus]QOW00844.1 hypothetical protein INP59_11355 [Rhodococcus pyridinivorans]QXU55767.1 hypothetical protein KXC42_11585 [Rhodococcus sp. LW-XY12]UPW04663.1 hypothetical protein M1C57_00785 [Rhodococcus pyridinivorans]USI92362.1 hypothetical protein LLA01_11205 [Rhodococcus pyridinivorans]WMM74855.1 hypothetical protein RCF27_11570 [Rhodococcus pyridinivorans]
MDRRIAAEVGEPEHSNRLLLGNDVEIRHASSQQRVSLTEVVGDVEAGDQRRDR